MHAAYVDRALAAIHHRVGWIVHYMPRFIGRPLGRALYGAWERRNAR